jgi:hypothetical protein
MPGATALIRIPFLAYSIARRRVTASRPPLVGSVIVLPGETWHFHWAKSGEYVTQVTAIGLLGLEYHDLHDDPRLQRG